MAVEEGILLTHCCDSLSRTSWPRHTKDNGSYKMISVGKCRLKGGFLFKASPLIPGPVRLVRRVHKRRLLLWQAHCTLFSRLLDCCYFRIMKYWVTTNGDCPSPVKYQNIYIPVFETSSCQLCPPISLVYPVSVWILYLRVVFCVTLSCRYTNHCLSVFLNHFCAPHLTTFVTCSHSLSAIP